MEATLRKCGELLVPELVYFILKKASKIFAILITMGQPKLIKAFYKNDFGQEKLPVELESVQEGLSRLAGNTDSLWTSTAQSNGGLQLRYSLKSSSGMSLGSFITVLHNTGQTSG